MENLSETSIKKELEIKKQNPPKKVFIVSCILLVSLFLIIPAVVFAAGMVVAYNSNSNIPVFSDAVEKLENAVVSNDKFSEIVQDGIAGSLFSTASQIGELDEEEKVVSGELKDQISNLFSIKDIKSYKFDIDFSTSSKTDSYSQEGTFNLKGGIDTSETPEFEAVVSGNYLINGDKGEGTAEVKLLEKTLYANVDNYTGVLPYVDKEKLFDKWMFLSLETNDTYNNIQGQQNLNEEDLKKVKEVLTSDEIGNHIKRLPDEIIGNIRANCFEFFLDKEGMIEVSNKIKKVVQNEELTETDKTNINDYFEHLRFTACAGRRDGLIYKLTAEVKSTAVGGALVQEYKLRVNLSDYNQGIEVEKPEDAKKFEDVYQDAFIYPEEADYH